MREYFQVVDTKTEAARDELYEGAYPRAVPHSRPCVLATQLSAAPRSAPPPIHPLHLPSPSSSSTPVPPANPAPTRAEAGVLRSREVDYRAELAGPSAEGSSLPLVGPDDIAAIVAAWTGIQVEALSAGEKDRLLGCVGFPESWLAAPAAQRAGREGQGGSARLCHLALCSASPTPLRCRRAAIPNRTTGCPRR